MDLKSTYALLTMNNTVYWNYDYRPSTSTLGKFPRKRGGLPTDMLKYQFSFFFFLPELS